MFKNKIIKASLLLTVLLSGGACENYLDLRPENEIVRDEFWQTKEQVESSVIGIYATMLSAEYTEKLFLWGELRADMIVPTPRVAAYEMEVINGNVLPTNRIADWGSFYQVINLCNTVIELAPQVLEIDPTLSEEELNGYLAEAYALRALNYFYLVRAFREVPLKLDATISDDVVFDLPKSSEEEILDQIEQDLAIAEPMAVQTYGNQNSDKGRVTSYTVNAIQADVNLWRGDFAECVTACDKIINSGQFGLVAGQNNPLWFQALYGEGNSSEAIFELQFSQARTNSFYSMFNPTAGGRFLVAPAVIDEVFTRDEDNPLNVDIRMNASVRPETSAVWKYLGLSEDRTRSANESTAHWIFYRYADVLLMKAEALALLQDGRGQEALDIINRIRTRANALPATENFVSPESTAGIVEYILEERQREFAYEGKRWFDLLRVARRNNYERMDLLIEAVMENAPSDRQQSIINKYRDSNSHYWPILQSEMDKNNKLVQNPFYSSL